MSADDPVILVRMVADDTPAKAVKQKEVQTAFSTVRLVAGSGTSSDGRQVVQLASKLSTRKRALISVFADQLVYLCSSQGQAQGAVSNGIAAGMVMSNGTFEITGTNELWISTQANTNGYVGIASESQAP